jgi:hypothetical protein
MPALHFPRSSAALRAAGFAARDLHELPDSPRRFADGGQSRPSRGPSVEDPIAFQTVVDEASLAGQHSMEALLFTGPRAGWDVGAQARSSSGAVAAGALRGNDQLCLRR